jgi:hypothetical protein
MEVVGSVEEELARVSQSFTDQSLRFSGGCRMRIKGAKTMEMLICMKI